MKKPLVITLIVLAVIVVGAFFGVQAYRGQQEELARQQQEEEKQEQLRELEEQQRQAQLAEEALTQRLQTGQYDPNDKIVFLTFDDGPNDNTGQVLDILARNDVKATFFTNGHEGYDDLYRRIASEGHVLANHTYTHDYSMYNDPQTFMENVRAEEELLRNITGTEPVKLLRFPGGSTAANQACIDALTQNGYAYVDWSASAGDGSNVTLEPVQVVQKILTEMAGQQVAVVLTHAENPAKVTTLQALENLIQTLKSQGYRFMTIDPSYQLPRFI